MQQQHYEVLEMAGEGSFGEVFKARDKRTGKLVAIKKVKYCCKGEGIPHSSLREIAALKFLKHDRIIELQTNFCIGNQLYMIFEYVDRDLYRYLNATAELLSPAVVKSLTSQLLDGIYYCHSRGIVHRDLKPQNILISNCGSLKIADFGLARSFVPPLQTMTADMVSLWYRPPEILLGSRVYSPAVDMWGVGAIIGEMVSKRVLFASDCFILQLLVIFHELGTPNEETWPGVSSLRDWNDNFPKFPGTNLLQSLPGICPEGLSLIEGLLTQDPVKRMSALVAKSHPFLKTD